MKNNCTNDTKETGSTACLLQTVFGGYFLFTFVVSSTTLPLNQTTAIANFII
jgi:hypothetical protein